MSDDQTSADAAADAADPPFDAQSLRLEQPEGVDGVYVLKMDNGENRFNAASIARMHELLDVLDAVEGPKALVTVGSGKFFSNGLDLDWLMSPTRAETPNFMDEVHRLFGRILFNEAYTVAAINGHAFAGGAMLAAAHDHRVMRSDRGYFCIPEVDLGLPLSPGMTAVLQARIPPAALHVAVATGKRWPAPELLAAGAIEDAVPEADVLPSAIDHANSFAKGAGDCLATMKRGLYPQAHEVLLG